MKINKTKYLIATFLLSTIGIPFSAHAMFANQTSKSANADVAYNGNGTQTIGQSSGTLQSVALSFSSGTTQNIQLQIREYSDSGYSNCLNIWQVGNSDYSINAGTSIAGGTSQGDLTFDFTYTRKVGCYDQSTLLDSSTYLSLNPSHYYVLQWLHTYGQSLSIWGSSADTFANGTCTSACGSISDLSMTFNGNDAPPDNGLSQIISFTPADATTTSSTAVTFTYKAYINGNDLSFLSGKQMTFYVQGQPVGFSTYFLDKVQATTSGYYNYSTTTVLSPGNYILNACIEDAELGGIIGGFDSLNPWSNSCQYHQFVVGTSTFVGNLFQNGVSSIQSEVNNITATSSAAILGNYCNPFSGFDIVQCFYALLIPTSSQLQDTMNSFYSDFLTRIPWGYGSVAVADLLGYGKAATTSLTSSNLTIVLPNTGVFATATSTSVLKGQSMTFIDWNQIASSTVQNYWSSALTPLNSFLNMMMGGAFIFWLYHFFKHMHP